MVNNRWFIVILREKNQLITVSYVASMQRICNVRKIKNEDMRKNCRFGELVGGVLINDNEFNLIGEWMKV